MNMQLRQCLARAKPFRLKKNKKPDFDCIFDFKKKAVISKFGFKNSKLATLHATSNSMGPLLRHKARYWTTLTEQGNSYSLFCGFLAIIGILFDFT